MGEGEEEDAAGWDAEKRCGLKVSRRKTQGHIKHENIGSRDSRHVLTDSLDDLREECGGTTLLSRDTALLGNEDIGTSPF